MAKMILYRVDLDARKMRTRILSSLYWIDAKYEVFWSTRSKISQVDQCHTSFFLLLGVETATGQSRDGQLKVNGNSRYRKVDLTKIP